MSYSQYIVDSRAILRLTRNIDGSLHIIQENDGRVFEFLSHGRAS